MNATVGFVGLGLMGAGFTKRLAAAGRRVVGHDLDAERREAARAWGVEPVATPAETLREASVVGICVTTSAAVEAVVTGDDGFLSLGDLSGRTVIDFSTTEMDVTHRVAAAVAKAGGAFVDAPVSGGPPLAEEGRLAIMAGGEDAAVAAARPMLGLAGSVTHMGPTGAGQATKLVNQVLCLTNYAIVAEALRLAEAYGVDAVKVPAALEPGLGNSAVLQSVYPRMVARDYAPRGYARQVLKDLEMVHAATREHHLAMPMTDTALTLFRMLVGHGSAELDGAAVVTLLPEAGEH